MEGTSEFSKEEKDKYFMILFISGNKTWHKLTYLQKKKTNSWAWRTDLLLPGWRGREWDGQGFCG